MAILELIDNLSQWLLSAVIGTSFMGTLGLLGYAIFDIARILVRQASVRGS